jgi:predicted tellurium resistance membrane protein TerC
MAPVVWLLSSADDAVTYTTIYFVERSLSLDNLFVFLLLFSYFACRAAPGEPAVLGHRRGAGAARAWRSSAASR